MRYSVVVAAYNEAENVSELHREITRVMRSLGEQFEIIIVDDGSTDGTEKVLRELSPLTVVSLRRNFGQTAAWDAGFKQAVGDMVIVLDADMQNPPSEIPKLLAKMREGDYDVVSGWRRKRKDPLLKRFVSRTAYVLRGFFVKDGIHDSGCSLKVYKKEALRGLDLHGEMHRFIVAILRWRGFKIGEVEVEHKPRLHGQTKYNWKRTVKSFSDMISLWFWRKYASRPLHIFGTLGFGVSLVGFILLSVLFVLRLIGIISLANSVWPMTGISLILTGIQFFTLGILSDMLMKQHYAANHMYYHVKNVTIQ